MISVLYTNENEEIFDGNQVSLHNLSLGFVDINKKTPDGVAFVAMLNPNSVKRLKVEPEKKE